MSTASSMPQPSISVDLDQVFDAVEAIRAAAELAYRNFMVSQGYDPAEGWVMVVPKGFIIGGPLPYFVMESATVKDHVVFIDQEYMKPWAP